MNGVEFIVIEGLKRKKWDNVLLHLDQLLSDENQHQKMDEEKQLAYLLWRSQCYFELGRHEACIEDCQKLMRLLPNEEPRNNFWFKSRWRLTHSLIQLKRLEEAKEIVEQLKNLCTDFTKQECVKLLERIEIGLHFTKRESDSKSSSLVGELGMNGDQNQLGSTFSAAEIKENKAAGKYHCVFCNVSHDNVDDFRSHCSTQIHQRTVMSDEGRDWKKRPPPRGLTADTYNLCQSYRSSAIGGCSNGAQCVDAHGVEELNEWKERFEYRMMRLERANESLLYGKSYTGRLLDKLSDSSNPETIIRESIEDVEENIEGDLTTVIETKISSKKWVFTLKTPRLLKVVALLYDSHRNHFSLQRIRTSDETNTLLNDQPINNQEWISRLDMEPELKFTHVVEVSFSTKLYGTFRQSVVFDFGSEPFLVKHLCVDVVPVNDAEKIKEVKQELVLSSSERWEESNSIIIPFTSKIVNHSFTEREQDLLAKYFVPTGHKFNITQSMLNDDRLTKNNYRSRMHELLYIEEMACYDQVAKYSVQASMQVIDRYVLSVGMYAASTAKFATSGEYFALITLNEDVSEDSPGGRLVLNNCVTVLLTDGKKVRNGDKSKLKVYEALIEDKGKNVVYLRLSSRTVADLKLKPDTSVTLEMQFQLNRIPFCEWHQAVDCVSNYSIIFPDVLNIPIIPKITDVQWTSDDRKLNEKQKEAIVAITASSDVPLPPVLIIGPFGTGKTYTLARAVRHILEEKDTKILICTHSNSAADLYIKEYLHAYVQSGFTQARPLRIYYHKRWVSTVNSTVLEYCCTEVVQNGMRIFKVPELEDILKHRVIVVTLNISSHLSAIGLPKGHFTHILLDEAAQAIECEAIMPLSLANEMTRIVLAGDHMQLSPEIFSPFAKQKKFHISLLQRLYESYPPDFPCKIVLCENYRAHKAIVQFTSSLFYDSKLLSLGAQPRHKRFYPLTFFTALGEDVQEKNSTGFFNCAEVYELVERVAELKKDWPECWGKFNEHSIGVMTPYPDQVHRIRIELKKRKLMGISVERVLNVQGKQFRVVFLSTVRTSRTCVTDEVDTEDTSLFDYGFLSNKKLLNTAVTRAQSLVAVVGDPVSLCSVGRCRKIWETFVETCFKNNSLFGLSWQDMKSLLFAVELKKKYKLNPLAPEFVPRHLQMEPYLQFMGAPLTRPPPGLHSMNAGLSNVSSQALGANRVYMYDNVRYQLPQKPIMQPSFMQQQSHISPSKWSNPPPPLPPVNSIVRSPPGFVPLSVAPNSVIYPQQVPTQSYADVYQTSQFTSPPARYLPPSTIRTNTIAPDTNIPLQLTLIPLSQYMRSQSPSAAYTISAPKTFNPPVLNLPAPPVCAQPMAARNGFNGFNIPDVCNGLKSQQESSTAPSNGTYIANVCCNGLKSQQGYPVFVGSRPAAPSAGHEPLEYDVKDLLPSGFTLEDVLKDTDLQKQWTSFLIDSKQLHRAKMFLNLISVAGQRKDIRKMNGKVGQKFEIDSLNSSEASLTQFQMSTASASKSEDLGDDLSSSIPLDVHLPSSLLPDLLPPKRQGPLYKRQSSTASSSMNGGLDNYECGINNEQQTSTRNNLQKAYHLNSSYADPNKDYSKLQNGGYDYGYGNKMQAGAHSGDLAACKDAQKFLFGNHPQDLHGLFTSFGKAKTYAAALRQEQTISEQRINKVKNLGLVNDSSLRLF